MEILTGDRAKNFPRECLYRGETVPEDIVLRGMKSYEKDLKNRLHNEWEKKKEVFRLGKKISEPFINLLNQDENATNCAKKLIEVLGRSKASKQEPPEVLEREMIIIDEDNCSLSHMVTPPYDYVFTFKDMRGNPLDHYYAANKLRGTYLSLDETAEFGRGGDSSVDTIEYLGIYYSPIINGQLTISINPTIAYFWGVKDLWFGAASTWATFGLRVDRNTWDGKFEGTVIDIQDNLWFEVVNFDIYAEKHDFKTISKNLSVNLSVDTDHWYVIWAYLSDFVGASGTSGLTFGAAGTYIGAALPYIRWDFHCIQGPPPYDQIHI